MYELITTHRAYLQYLAILFLAAIGLWRGGGPEKAIGLVLIAILSLTLTFHFLLSPGTKRAFDQVDLELLVLDALAAIALAVIALKANRIYPLWVFGAQLISVATHLSRELSQIMNPLAYFLLYVLPSYIQICAYAMGIYCHLRRKRKYGTYRSWRRS